MEEAEARARAFMIVDGKVVKEQLRYQASGYQDYDQMVWLVSLLSPPAVERFTT